MWVPAPGQPEGSAVFQVKPLDIRVNNQSFYANEEAAVGASADVLVRATRWTDMPAVTNANTTAYYFQRVGPEHDPHPRHGPATTMADEIRPTSI